MARWWTRLGVGFSLLGALALGESSYATPQEPGANVGTEKSGDGRGNSNRKAGESEQLEDRENSVGLHLLKNIAKDQKALWIGPKNLRWVDADWLVPLGGAAAAMFVTDSTYSRHLSNSPSRIKYSKDVSNYGLASMVGIGGGLYLWGHITHDDHKMETGILAGEAAIDSLTPVYAMKYAFGRERPLEDNYRGRFGQGGVSFPSEHAAAAWSIASVIAHEYPGPLTSLFVYGLASAVSASRITSKQHFPSDVLVGSAIGWFEGMYVYRKHHDPTVGGGEWETYVEAQEGNERSSRNMGSPYVPLDSWIYPALERLIAQGYISDAIVGMRPWTRSECARLVDEVQDSMEDASRTSSEIGRLVDVLRQEFVSERELLDAGNNRQLRLESIYTRFTNISGEPLTDGFHFGQTLINDYGRPFNEGLNNVTGFSGWASSGRFITYIRGEFQHAPSIAALPDQARQFIATSFGTLPVPPAFATPSINRFEMLDAYVGMNVDNWQFTFGRQSLWLGPGEGGPMLFSDNAAPVTMFRIDRTTPTRLPWIFGLMGPVRWEFFLGRLSGQHFVRGDATGLIGEWDHTLADQPFIVGQKFNFKPTKDFEFGVGYTRITAGPGQPFNTHQFLKSVFGTRNGAPGTSADPGDVRSGVDFSYKIPGMRNWLTFYGNAFTEDEYSPLGYPGKSAFEGGIYLPRIPGVSKLDLHVEGGSTSPVDFPECNGCFYTNTRFVSGYTNEGNLVGTWIGRASQGERAWTTYWVSSTNTIQFNYQHRKIDGQFIPGGGTSNDSGVKIDFSLGRTIRLGASLQYERWNIPVLSALPKTNLTSSVQLSFWPPTSGLQRH